MRILGCSHPLRNTGCYLFIFGECYEIKECRSDELINGILSIADPRKFKTGQIIKEIGGKRQECRIKILAIRAAEHKQPQR